MPRLLEANPAVTVLTKTQRSVQTVHIRLRTAGAGSRQSTAARLAAELGDGLFATDPEAQIVDTYRGTGGRGSGYAEVGMAWAPDEQTAAQAALDTTRWALTGWKVMSELPNPVNFAAATTTVRRDDILERFACGSDPKRYLEVAQQYVDAGFDHLVMQNAAPDPEGFIDFYRSELDTPMRELTPAS